MDKVRSNLPRNKNLSFFGTSPTFNSSKSDKITQQQPRYARRHLSCLSLQVINLSFFFSKLNDLKFGNLIFYDLVNFGYVNFFKNNKFGLS